MWNMKRPQIIQTNLGEKKGTKMEDSDFLISKLTTKLQLLKQCGSRIKYIYINGGAQKYALQKYLLE
jgi:hypothetical protein